MKVIILAGGFGTRLSEYTDSIPKPMVSIAGQPILIHLMKYFASYGHKEFYLALGYKAELIKQFFLNYNTLNSDFTLFFEDNSIEVHNEVGSDWKVTLVDTGLNSMTGGRVKRLQNYIGEEPFMLTYGDGLSDVDLDNLLDFHNQHGKIATVTAVHPAARFGELDIAGSVVKSFKEKPQVTQGWINGGFFVANKGFFDYLDNDLTVLEEEPLENLSSHEELMAFKHEGFWQCMDTKRDRDLLEQMWNANNAPWKR